MANLFGYERPNAVERFLDEHPERGAEIEDAEQWLHYERQTLSQAIRDIYGFVEIGVPPRHRLIWNLQHLVSLLQENAERLRRLTDAGIDLERPPGLRTALEIQREEKLPWGPWHAPRTAGSRLAVYKAAAETLKELELSFADPRSARAFGRLLVLVTAAWLGEPRARRRLDRERDALDATIRRGLRRESGTDVEHFLEEQLSPTVARYLAGDFERPGDEKQIRLRLRAAAEITRTITDRYDPETVKRWLFRTNAGLDDEAPSSVIRHARDWNELLRVILAATRISRD